LIFSNQDGDLLVINEVNKNQEEERDKMKKIITMIIIVLIIAIVILFLKYERSVPFEKIGSFEWTNEIHRDDYPPLGRFWWCLYQNPESYISYENAQDLYNYTTGKEIETQFTFDFENYTYVVVSGHELIDLSYNYWNVEGRFKSPNPVFHGRAKLKTAENKKSINIYRIERMLINSDEHGGRNDRIFFVD